VPEALLMRARQPPGRGSEVLRLVPRAAKPLLSDAPPPQGTVPVGQVASPPVLKIEAGAAMSGERTMR
jgi:hypothetical protein